MAQDRPDRLVGGGSGKPRLAVAGRDRRDAAAEGACPAVSGRRCGEEGGDGCRGGGQGGDSGGGAPGGEGLPVERVEPLGLGCRGARGRCWPGSGGGAPGRRRSGAGRGQPRRHLCGLRVALPPPRPALRRRRRCVGGAPGGRGVARDCAGLWRLWQPVETRGKTIRATVCLISVLVGHRLRALACPAKIRVACRFRPEFPGNAAPMGVFAAVTGKCPP